MSLSVLVATHGTVILVVAMGAITHALVEVKSARNTERPFDLIDVAIAFAVALFSGAMFAFGAAYFSGEEALLHGCAGMGAFLGLNGLNRIGELLMDSVAKRAAKLEKRA